METWFAPRGAEPIGSNTAPRQLNRFGVALTASRCKTSRLIAEPAEPRHPRLETAYPARQQTPNRKIPGDRESSTLPLSPMERVFLSNRQTGACMRRPGRIVSAQLSTEPGQLQNILWALIPLYRLSHPMFCPTKSYNF
jgi:hypothetical protein